MKKILFGLLFILSLFTIWSCNEEVVDTPIEELKIEINDDKLSWNRIDNSKNYVIYVNDVEYKTVFITNFNLKLDYGTYTIYVKCNLLNDKEIISNKLDYSSNNHLSNLTIEINDNLVTWNKIDGIKKYQIYVDNNLAIETNGCEYLIEDDITCIIYVIGIYDDDSTIKSNEEKHYCQVDKEGKLTVFEINDTHGSLTTEDNGYGMAQVSTIIKELEKTSELLKIANGDIFQGSYVSNTARGLPFIEILNNLNFDLFVIGNHEFDWGFDTIHQYKDGKKENGEADFPFVACNIYYKDSNEYVSWLEPYTICYKNGYKIGVIGAIGEGLESSISTKKVEDYEFVDPLPLIEGYAESLRVEEKCDVVIVSIHEYESSTNQRIATLNGDSRIDGIICGHTHQKINEYYSRSDNYRIPCVQSNTKNLSVGSIEYSLTGHLINSGTIKHYNPSYYDSDEAISNLLKKYQDLFNEAEEVIGYTSSYLGRDDIGYMAVNEMNKLLNVDVSCMNTGGIRTTINSGYVRIKNVFEVCPFDNQIIIVSINGRSLANYYRRQGNYLYFNTSFNPNNLNNDTVYKLAVIDYVYWGSGYYYLKDFPMTETNYYIRDILIMAFKDK